MSWIIRTARPEDLKSLQTVFRRSSLSNEGDRDVLLAHPEHLALAVEPLRDGRTRLAEDLNGRILGFATVERFSDSAELIDLFVDPESMRKGIGRALLDDVLAALAKDRIHDLWVTANPNAMPFYNAMGFESIEPTTTPLGSGMRMKVRCEARGRDS